MEQKSPWSLKEALGYIKKEYDVCLIDTRPVFDVLTKNALYAADVLLTPVKFDNFCRDNLAMVEDAYHELKEKKSGIEMEGIREHGCKRESTESIFCRPAWKT